MKKVMLAFFFGAVIAAAPVTFGKEPDETLQLLENVIQQVREGKLTRYQLQAFAGHRNPFDKKAKPESGEGIFPTKVNYDLSMESLMAQGNYGWKNSDINSKHFQTARKGEATLNLEVVHLNQQLASEEVIAELKKRGLRPAEIHELLFFGAQYPDEQRKYSIVALGSVWRGWHGSYRFLAVREF